MKIEHLLPLVRRAIGKLGAETRRQLTFTDSEIMEALVRISQEPEFAAKVSIAELAAGAARLARGKSVDLITMPNGIDGTNCGNCRFFSEDGMCRNAKVDQPVTPRMCCNLWDAPGTTRSWEQASES